MYIIHNTVYRVLRHYYYMCIYTGNNIYDDDTICTGRYRVQAGIVLHGNN